MNVFAIVSYFHKIVHNVLHVLKIVSFGWNANDFILAQTIGY